MVSQEMKLLAMLSNNNVTFYIPPYQRNYEWTEEQCQIFFEDVRRTCDQNILGKTTEHFFGTITYFQTEQVFGQPNRLVLIDGQQRITTTMLFLAALRDVIADEDLKQYINENYLMNHKVASGEEFKIKLKQVEADWETYKEIMFQDIITANVKVSAVFRNYKYFFNKLQAYATDGNDLRALVDKGLNKFSVITIELKPDVNKWENPQEIFESMNSLGKPLSLADLVRNYLLLGLDATTQEEYYRKYWLAIERAVPGQVSNYIRDFMQWQSGVWHKQASENNYKELYWTFKKLFCDTKSEDILHELSLRANVYAVVIGNKHSGHKIIDNVLMDLRYFRVTTAYSFLLALLSDFMDGKFSVQDIADIMTVFLIYIERRRLIRMAVGAENKDFPALIKHLPLLAASPNKKDMMFSVLASQEANLRVPNDVEIAKYLESANFYNFQYCKFYLALVEERITKSRPDLSDTTLQLEHIMPRTLSNEWRDALGDNCDAVHQELVDTIGNLTLIRHNQELGNKSFAVKKDVYENNSGLQIAKTEIIKYDVWNADTIKNRTAWLVAYMLQNVLPIPDEMRKKNNFISKNRSGLSFVSLGLLDQEINFVGDKTIVARIVDDEHVEFEGQHWTLSALTKELYSRMGKARTHSAYQGVRYWEYDGVRLVDVM